MATADRKKIELPQVRQYFDDEEAGRRVDEVFQELIYVLATQYAPPVPKVSRFFDEVITLTDGDTTPDVSAGNAFKTANTSATTITQFDGGVEGQDLLLVFGDGDTTIDFASGVNITGNGGADFNGAAGDTILFVRHDGIWRGFISEA